MEIRERGSDVIEDDEIEEEYHGKSAVIILGNKYDAGGGYLLSHGHPTEIHIKDYVINNNGIVTMITDNDTKIVASIKNVVIYEYA